MSPDVDRYFAPWALLPTGWTRDVRVDVARSGTIDDVVPASPRDGALLLNGALIPGMPNGHSHVFQRALAGRTEGRGGGDSFWSWRDAMYAFLDEVDPDAFERLATDVFADMLEAGYTSVAEFHYVHHGPRGIPYARRSEMAERVIAAAKAAGIGLTLLPVLYRYADFGNVAPEPRQARFVNGLDDFAELFATLAASVAHEPFVRLGAAPHSLRAVGLDDLPRLVALVDEYAPAAPLHVHVAEQEREVEACRHAHGATPVELLAASVDLGPRWSLVHATHATEGERIAIADALAIVVVCPTTEANLGDGFFPAVAFRRERGRMAIGSDSNVSLDVAEELRWLEYGQRLALQRRAALGDDRFDSLGEALYVRAVEAGRQAVDQPVGALEPGARADLVVLALDEAELDIDGRPSLDAYVFRSGSWRVRDVYVGGRHVVTGGVHASRA